MLQRLHSILLPAVFLCVLALQTAMAEEAKIPEIHALTPEQKLLYGNRAEFIQRLPDSLRPDADWRSALSDRLADAEPQWSQGYEELIIRDFFGDRREGIFVDVGCYKPKAGSTTFYLEDQLGWTGIGIDAMEHFRRPWERFRPQSTFIQAVVSDKDGEKRELHVAYNMVSLDSEVIDAWGLRDRAKVVEVETMTLDTILDKQDIGKVDFVSIDIEGAELEALASFDLKRFAPKLLAVETATHEPVIAHFQANGYELIDKYFKADKINLYFRPKKSD